MSGPRKGKFGYKLKKKVGKFFNLFILSAKYVCRNRTRSFLTMMGVATGMFLFATIETMQNSLKDAVASANDTTMIAL